MYSSSDNCSINAIIASIIGIGILVIIIGLSVPGALASLTPATAPSAQPDDNFVCPFQKKCR